MSRVWIFTFILVWKIYSVIPTTAEQLQAIKRYGRDHYEDEDPSTYDDGRIDCSADCGGYVHGGNDCGTSMVQVYCYTPIGTICCVDKTCHEAGGVCRNAPLLGEVELPFTTQCPPSKKCFVKSCVECNGLCYDGECPVNTKLSPTEKCHCPNGLNCCIPDDSCETDKFWCQDKSCNNNCDPPRTIECKDNPCVCPPDEKCCEKNCNLNENNEDMCAKEFPGRGKCRTSPVCEWDEKEMGTKGQFCNNGCICCKKLLHCDLCNGICHGDCTQLGLVPTKNCKCNVGEGICCVSGNPFPFGTEVGDPHFETFDGLKFNFHGPCTYKLFQDCTEKRTFAVHTEHYSTFNNGHNKTYVLIVRVFLPTDVIELSNTDVKVNGKSVYFSLPVTIANSMEIRFNKQKTRVIVDYHGVFTLSWNGNGAVKADLDEAWHGRVCGLLGDANGDENNDMKMLLPDGTLKLTDDVNEFGYSWEVPGSCSKKLTKNGAI